MQQLGNHLKRCSCCDLDINNTVVVVSLYMLQKLKFKHDILFSDGDHEVLTCPQGRYTTELKQKVQSQVFKQ